MRCALPAAGRTAALILVSILAVPGPARAGLELLRADDRGVTFRYEAGVPALTVDPDGATRVALDEGEHLGRPGEVDLPSRVVRVGLPQDGGFRLAVETGPVTETRVAGVARVAPCSREAAVARDARPAAPAGPGVEAGDTGRLRDVRVAELLIRPVAYDSGAGLLRSCEWLEVTVSFDGRPVENRSVEALDDAIGRMLVNGARALGWKLDAGQDRTGGFFDRYPFWLKLRIEETGIYGITAAELAAAGVPVDGIDPATIAIYTMGEHQANGPYPDTMVPVARWVEGGDDGALDPADLVVFYARAAEHWAARCSAWVANSYTDAGVYWLAWGGSPGLRMVRGLGPDTSGTPVVDIGRDVRHEERDAICPARSGLLWLWQAVEKGADRDLARFDAELKLAYPVRVRRLAGRLMTENAGNRMTVLFNRRPVDSLEFGYAPPSLPLDFGFDMDIPAPGRDNELSLLLGGDGGKTVYVDWFDVEYDRRLSLHGGQLHFLADDTGTFRFSVRDVPGPAVVLDVTDPYRPTMSDGFEEYRDSLRFCRTVLAPAEFEVAAASQLLRPAAMTLRRPGRLSRPGNCLDYWVVAPAEFLSPAQALARHRSGSVPGVADCRAGVAVLEEVYDDYAFGFEEPGAIKRFMADKRPIYGVLIGDATYDYKDRLGLRTGPGVPPYEFGYGLEASAYDRNTVAFDAWYADFDGTGALPDMILGRVTARTPEELARYVEKVVRYEEGPAGNWTRRFILLADDEYEGEVNRPDPIGLGHVEQAEAMAVLPGDLVDPVKVYLTEYPYVGVKNKPGARAEIRAELERGAVALVFFGHGDAFDLTHESVLNISQVGDIDNDDRMPFCFFGSCGVGRFEDTRYECIAEEIVRRESGAIAAVGASKATTSGANLIFARNLLVPLFGHADSTVGSAFFTAWPTDRIYHLFGDPAVQLRLGALSGQSLVVRPETLQPGVRFLGRMTVEVTSGRGTWQLAGPKRLRTYRSERGQVNYVLPGPLLGRGNVTVDNGLFAGQGIFPFGLALDTVFVANGQYAPVERSCRMTGSVWNDSTQLSVVAAGIPHLTDPGPAGDGTGPEVGLAFGGLRLRDGAAVPARFELEGTLSDPAGILVAPVPGANPRLFVNTPAAAVDLTDRLVFDDNTSATARFRIEVELEGSEDTLTVTAFDNFLNRTVAAVSVRPLPADEPLAVESVLVYPNPVGTDARVTFLVNRPAGVRVRVFSLRGTLVRDLGARAAGYGYNEVYWDGRDQQGRRPANGVYLVTLTATAAAVGGSQTVRARERFLVVR